MTITDDIAARFETERPRLRAVAAGILGSVHEADDAVQEAWFRLDRANQAEIRNLSAWLTVVVSRIALDHIRARSIRREVPIDSPAASGIAVDAPVDSAVIFEESVYDALSHAVYQLSPLETASFVLHDLFRLPFDEIADIVERSPAATRQLASRARKKVATATPASPAPNASRRQVIEAFLDAAQSGDLQRLIAVLAPNALLRADATTVSYGTQPELTGPDQIAGQFLGRAHAARLTWLNGVIGAAWVDRGSVKVAFDFTIDDGVIQEIALHADPATLATIDFEIEPPQKKRNARG